jgi:hypothetical protein
MAGNGYGNVVDTGFLSFAGALEEGAWKDISIKKHDSEEMLASTPLVTTPVAVKWKLTSAWGIRALVAAMSVGNTADLDKEWDAAQRAFAAGVASEEDHQDPAYRAAAGRIRTALLSGAGTIQTQSDLDKEVDFGQKQLLLAEQKDLAADLKLTGLGPRLERIRAATLALGKGIGREPGKNRAPARSLRIRDALRECSGAFNLVHDDLVWAIAHTPSGPERDKLEKMLEPFQALLDRYPASPGATAGSVKPAFEPSPTETDAKDEPSTGAT